MFGSLNVEISILEFMMQQAEIAYHHRDDQGIVNDEVRPIPYCCLCYTHIIHDKGISSVYADLDTHFYDDPKIKNSNILVV